MLPILKSIVHPKCVPLKNMLWSAQWKNCTSRGREYLPIGTKCSNARRQNPTGASVRMTSDDEIWPRSSAFLFNYASRIHAKVGQLRFDGFHHGGWSAQVEHLAEIGNVLFQEFFRNQPVRLAWYVFFKQKIDKFFSQETLAFRLQYNVVLRLVCENEFVIVDAFLRFEGTKNGNKGSNACSTSDEYALAAIFDCAEDVVQDERIAGRERSQFVGNPFTGRVSLDGEFKVIVGGKACEGERSSLLLPSGLVEENFRGLTRCKR